jgi:hypothetical protein
MVVPNSDSNKGYIALTTILILGIILILITTTQALTSVNEGQFSLAGVKKDSALGFVESCGEDALIKLNKNNTIPSTIFLPSGTCAVTINGNVGTGWTFTVTGSQDNYYESIKIQAIRNSTLNLTGWQEN